MPKTMSEDARRRISEAQKRRWAKVRASGGTKRKKAAKGGAGWTAAKRAAQSRKIKAALARRRSGGASKGRGLAMSPRDYGSVSNEELIAMRRGIDLELADRFVRGAV